MRPFEWMTAGGNCNTAACNTAYWSGASLNDVEDGTNFLMKNLSIKKSPLNWCPQAKAQ